MNHDRYSDAYILDVLGRTRTLAMVGASPHWNRPSYFVMKYLQKKRFRVIPVNPAHAGKQILGEHIYGSLGEIPTSFEMVDIFRNSQAAGEITDQALVVAADKGLRTVWMQLGVRSVFTFGVKGGYDAGIRVVEAVELFSHLANVGDTRSLILHPASTTHRQLSEEQRRAAGAGDDVVRLSVGIESVDDLIDDLDRALGIAVSPQGR